MELPQNNEGLGLTGAITGSYGKKLYNINDNDRGKLFF